MVRVVQITLKKGDEFAKRALEAAQQLRFAQQASISVFSWQEPQEIVKTIAEENRVALQQFIALEGAAARIRQMLGRENVQSGTSDRLATIKSNDRIIAKLREIVGESDTPLRRHFAATEVAHDTDFTAVEAQMKALRAAAEGGESRETRISLPVTDRATRAELSAMIARLRRENSSLQDENSAANLGRKITLDAEVVAVLRQHGIIEG